METWILLLLVATGTVVAIICIALHQNNTIPDESIKEAYLDMQAQKETLEFNKTYKQP